MPVGRAKCEISSTEFLRWKVYLDRDAKKPTRDQHYFAQIAQEIRRVLHKNPSKVKLEDFLLEFTQKVQKAQQELTPEEKERRMAVSKAMWSAITTNVETYEVKGHGKPKRT